MDEILNTLKLNFEDYYKSNYSFKQFLLINLIM